MLSVLKPKMLQAHRNTADASATYFVSNFGTADMASDPRNANVNHTTNSNRNSNGGSFASTNIFGATRVPGSAMV